jgi:hypothetical protein
VRSAGSAAVGKLSTEVFGKLKYPCTNTRISRSGSPICCFVSEYSQILSRQRGGGGDVCEILFGEEGYARINGGTRVLELAADRWEATLGHGAR